MLIGLKRWLLHRLPAITQQTGRTVRYRGFEAKPDEHYRNFVEKQIAHPVKRLTLDWLAADDRLPERFSLLDVGCGPGAMARLIEDHPALRERVAYVGLDQSYDALAYCARTFPPYRFVQRDVLRDGVPEEPFDVIMLNEVIEHLPDYREILKTLVDARPRIFVLSTFAVLPELDRDRRLWRPDAACYMNSYALHRLYAYLRGIAPGTLRVADFGMERFDRYWFPRKTRMVWYLQPENTVDEAHEN